tara:strand:+ start:599 stop:1150 length:552 start_codon:yes stop_codon:yes gene_type:complete
MRITLISVMLFSIIITKANSDITKEVVSTLEKSNNYNFKFIQRINEKKETGNCILVFNRKINCKYDNSKKILISDGKNLIIKSNSSGVPNFYKLENTPFYRVLDRKFLIDQLKIKKIKIEKNNLYVDLNYQNTDIKVFFDKKKLHLKGWQTTDIYNNSVSTEIYIQGVNKIIDKNLFDINKYN